MIDAELARAVSLRESGAFDEARDLLLRLSSAAPDDARVAYQTAWVHDRLGLEGDAVPHYVRALDGDGLSAVERRGALLGLGSTYRTLGRYAEAVDVLSRGVREFPEDRALAVFLAMARYNTGDAKQAVAGLLTLLAETTTDPEIQRYRPAIELYAEDLDRIWS
ncbi:tetratricopeptide repeat protein [Kutzneria sp. CA-103260]|uniref:tetratricopeptide repeat protein n=1 Tax=Kutzneria sp. CA-103260 TaxID=2802641 RepID=UPI001BEFCD91|nr:tetratricopeptide repeat protein [Kutzneria sp. CA-103260]QUQ64731.1 tetratricopeptide repeat protein [Kutzneria sp. CA-103260]